MRLIQINFINVGGGRICGLKITSHEANCEGKNGLRSRNSIQDFMIINYGIQDTTI